ncbi:probable uridine nucleosidase 2 [Papilio machaon]|uniref:probable uridine nucleosidase 2 n=1 Tax=Papilio machaon TaxID=76193 RepID=UPI001E6642C2|nr:probable uridine nucleosidase 2 [Papilio machaon]
MHSSEDTIPGPKLVIDHDGGADDAMAIFMALQYQKYFGGNQVIALTTTHGNVNEPQVFNNTQKFLNIVDRRDVFIYRGSKFPLVEGIESDYYFGMDGLGDSESEFLEYEPIEAQSNSAALALIELSKKFEGELIVVALGPLTNIAMAVRLDPGFISRLLKLYVAGGHIFSEIYNEPEFNAEMDVESYYIVLQNSQPDIVTLVPFSQVYLSHNISREWRVSTLGSIPSELIRALNVFEQKSIVKSEKWILLDPVAMAIVLNKTQIIEEWRYTYNSIDLCGRGRGTNTNNFTSNEYFNSKIVYKVKEEPYKKMLIDIFSADLK